jgi:DNA-binding MarR family transcriptional regulator
MDGTSSPGSMVLLTRLARVVYRETHETVLGMRLKEYIALTYLREHPDLSQHLLAEALHMDANNCVLLLNELEVAGLAERRRDPTDRRRHIVALTPLGAKTLEGADRALEGVENQVLGALTPEQRRTLRELLSLALRASEAASGRAHPARVPTDG